MTCIGLRWLGVAALMLGGVRAGAVEFYVAPNGDDAQSGAIESPFASLARARDAVRAVRDGVDGDITVFLRGGTYRLTNTVVFGAADGGTNGHKVIYQAYTNENPVLSGAQPVTGWTLYDAGKNIWSAPVGTMRFRQLYVNAAPAIRARDPNTTNTVDRSPYYRALGVDLVGEALQVSTANWNVRAAGVADKTAMELIVMPVWYHDVLRYASHTVSGGSVWYTPQEPERSFAFKKPDYYYEQSSFWFENAYEFVDAPGEWFLDAGTGTLYYKPADGVSPADQVIEAPCLTTLLDVHGDAGCVVAALEFRDLVLEGSNWTAPSEYGVVMTQAAAPVHAPYTSMDPPGLVLLYHSSGVALRNCVIRNTGATGVMIWKNGDLTDLEGNQFSDIAANGITVDDTTKNPPPSSQSQSVAVWNNRFQRCGRVYTSGMPLYANQVRGLIFDHNEVSDMPYMGIQVGNQPGGALDVGCGQNKIRYNHIHHCMQLLKDGGGVYALGGKQAGTVIEENYIHDILSAPWGSGTRTDLSLAIYLDNSTQYVSIRRNVLERYGYIGGERNYAINNAHIDFPLGGTEGTLVKTNAGLKAGYTPRMSLLPQAASVTVPGTREADVEVDLSVLANGGDVPFSNLVFTAGSAVNGAVSMLPDGHTARFTVAANAGRTASFQYAVSEDVDHDPRLFLHYSFEPPADPSSGVIPDESPRHYDGTVQRYGTGSALLSSNVPSCLFRSTRSLDLTESSHPNAARVSRAVLPAPLGLSARSWTVAAWFNRRGTRNYDYVLHLGEGDGFGAEDEVLVYCPNADDTVILRHDRASGSEVIGTASGIATGEWHHVAVTFIKDSVPEPESYPGRGALTFFVDGKRIGSATVTLALDQNFPMIFGGHATTSALERWFDGGLDEVMVFGGALLDGEIGQLARGDGALSTFSLATNSVLLEVALPPVLTWDGGQGNGLWDTVSTNWGSVSTTWETNLVCSAAFGATGAGPVAVSLPLAVGDLLFDAPGYSLGGEPLSLVNPSVITVNHDTAIHLNLAGGAMFKDGPGALLLDGTNGYAGETTIGAGTVILGGSGRLGNGVYAGTIRNDGGLVYESTAAQTLGGVISGTGSLTKRGAATLTLSGLNSFTGDLTVEGGRLNLVGNATKAASLSVASGAVLVIGNSQNALGGVAGQQWEVGGQVNSTGTTVCQGLSGKIITLNNASLTAAATSNTHGSWQLNNTLFIAGGTNSMSGGTAGVVAGASVSTVSCPLPSDLFTVSTLLIDDNGVVGGSLRKTGEGTLLLNAANTLSGSLSVDQGRLVLNGSAASVGTLTVGAGATLTLGNTMNALGMVFGQVWSIGGCVDATGTTTAQSLANKIISLSNATLTARTTSSIHGSWQLSATTFGASGTCLMEGGSAGLNEGAGMTTIDLPGNTDLFTVSTRLVDDSGAQGALRKTGGGSLILAGTNSYSGPTLIEAGAVVVAVTNASDITVTGGALILAAPLAMGARPLTNEALNGLAFLNTNAFVLGGLNGAGSVTLTNADGAAVALTIGAGNASGNYGGTLAGPGSVVKTGTGRQTLGGFSSHTGTTTVQGGRLVLEGGGLTGGGSVRVTGPAVLSGSGTLSGPVELGSGATLLPGTDTATGTLYAGALSCSAGTTNSFWFIGGGVGGNSRVEVGGTLTLGGVVSIRSLDLVPLTNGIYRLFTYGTLEGSVPALLGNSSRNDWSLDTAGGRVDLVVSGAIPRDLAWVPALNGIWDAGTSNWFGTATDRFYDYDRVTFGNDGAGTCTVIVTGTLQPGSVTVNSASNYVFAGSGTLAGTGSLTKDGAGMLVVSNALGYSGVTVVKAGTLAYATTLGTGATTYSGTGTVRLTGVMSMNGNATFGPDFTGLLDVGMNGVFTSLNTTRFSTCLGDLNVGGSATFSIGGSVLRFDSLTGSGTLLNSAVASYAPATLTFGANGGEGSFSGRILSGSPVNGAITMIKEGGGLLTLGGVNTYSGSTAINGGTLVFSTPGNQTLEGVISGAGVLRKAGAGTLTLSPSAPCTHAGGTFVDEGTLVLAYYDAANNRGTIAGTLTVAAGATVSATVTKALGFANAAGGNVTEVMLNGGTLSLAPGVAGGIGGGQTVRMRGGTIQSNGGVSSSTATGYYRFTASGADPAIHVLASGTTAVMAGRVQLDGPAVLMVEDGPVAGDLLVSAAITGPASQSMIKGGAGVAVFSGVNTYTGTTTVAAGTLLVDNAGSATSGTGYGTVTVGDGGVLGGTGRVARAVTVASGGAVVPGDPAAANGIGMLTAAGDVTFAPGARFGVRMGDYQCSRLGVGGVAVVSNAVLEVTLVNPRLGYGNVYTALTATVISGRFAGLPDKALVTTTGGGFHVDYGAQAVTLRRMRGLMLMVQ